MHQQRGTAQNGDIVVALLEEEDEATLKRLRRKSYSIALEPANSKYETRIFGPDQVKIQGTLKALIRQYWPALWSIPNDDHQRHGLVHR